MWQVTIESEDVQPFGRFWKVELAGNEMSMPGSSSRSRRSMETEREAELVTVS